MATEMYKSENRKMVSRFLANIWSPPAKNKYINISSIYHLYVYIYNGLAMTNLSYSPDSTNLILSAYTYIIFSIRINRNIIADFVFTFFVGIFLFFWHYRLLEEFCLAKILQKAALYTSLYIGDSKTLVFRISPLFVFWPVHVYSHFFSLYIYYSCSNYIHFLYIRSNISFFIYILYI